MTVTRRLLWILLLPLLSGWSLTGHTEMPLTFSNEYRTRIMGFSITVTHELSSRDDGSQQLHFLAKTWVASLEEITRFRWEDQQIKPLEYQYKRRGLGRSRDTQLSFDWDAGEVTNTRDNKTWDMDTSLRIQDKLSYQVQLQKDLINGLENFQYHIADNGYFRDYQFEIVGEEVLDTPLGKVNTVKVKRSREDNDRVTYAWLAKDWQYILVRMQQEEDGDSYSLNLSKANINGKAIKRFD